MRTLEIRRHTDTKKGETRGRGSHLSAQGVRRARQIGGDIGLFDLILTSHLSRTLETAIAMGFAVDDQWEVLGDIPAEVWAEIGHHERWSWEQPFVEFARLVAQGGPTAEMGYQQRAAWLQALESVPLQGSVLIVSHGRVMESGVVACFPEADFAAWGAPFQHGEGVQLGYEEGHFTHIHFRRNTD